RRFTISLSAHLKIGGYAIEFILSPYAGRSYVPFGLCISLSRKRPDRNAELPSCAQAWLGRLATRTKALYPATSAAGARRGDSLRKGIEDRPVWWPSAMSATRTAS